jgi:hypothetical protein
MALHGLFVFSLAKNKCLNGSLCVFAFNYIFGIQWSIIENPAARDLAYL